HLIIDFGVSEPREKDDRARSEYLCQILRKHLLKVVVQRLGPSIPVGVLETVRTHARRDLVTVKVRGQLDWTKPDDAGREAGRGGWCERIPGFRRSRREHEKLGRIGTGRKAPGKRHRSQGSSRDAGQ